MIKRNAALPRPRRRPLLQLQPIDLPKILPIPRHQRCVACNRLRGDQPIERLLTGEGQIVDDPAIAEHVRVREHLDGHDPQQFLKQCRRWFSSPGTALAPFSSSIRVIIDMTGASGSARTRRQVSSSRSRSAMQMFVSMKIIQDRAVR